MNSEDGHQWKREGEHPQESAHVLQSQAIAAHEVHGLLRLTFQRRGDEFRRKKADAPQAGHAGQAQAHADQQVPPPHGMAEQVGDRADVPRRVRAFADLPPGLLLEHELLGHGLPANR